MDINATGTKMHARTQVREELSTSPGAVPQWSDLVDAMWREARQHSRGKTAQLDNQHRALYTAAFSDLTRKSVARPTRALLDYLATEFGLAWVDLSRMVGVSVPAIRKWRMDGGASPENHERVAQVWAFLTALRQHLHVDDPVTWLTRRLEPGFAVTVKHLWAPEWAGLLLDLAAGGTTAAQVLDRIDPQWHDTYATSDEVVIFDDGMPAIVQRG